MPQEQTDLSIPLLLIGTGIAGNVFARNLSQPLLDRGLAIESGMPGHHNAKVRRGRGLLPHADPMRYRRFGFGGTSLIWGGNLLPFRAEDFTLSKGGSLEWARVGAEVQGLEAKALEGLGFEKPDKTWSSFCALEDQLQTGSLGLMLNRLPNPVRYNEEDFPMRTIDGLVATKISQGDQGFVVSCVTADSRPVSIFANTVVLAAGTLESYRILSASLGLKGGPALGNYYSAHISGSLGFCLIPTDTLSNFKPEEVRNSTLGHSYRTYLLLRGKESSDAWKVTFLDLRHNLLAWFENPAALMRALIWRLSHPFDRRQICLVNFDGPQEPNSASRVVREGEDVFIEHRITPRDSASLRELERHVGHWAEGIGGKLLSSIPVIRGHSHHLGGLRVGDSMSDSVVNGDLELHRHSNLFCLSAGVFRVFGFANPTLFLAQLAVRLARKLSFDFEARCS